MGIMLSSAVCSFVCGVTEPFEFAFMFLSPALYIIYALLYGLVTYVTVISGFRAGFSFSGGVTDLFFSASLPAAARTWMILPLGALAFVLFYAVFRFAIQKWDLKMPGREDDEAPAGIVSSNTKRTSDGYAQKAQIILQGLGGAGNIVSLGNCITRLRLELADPSLIDEALIRSSGALAVIRTGKGAVQVVIGTTVQFVADELRDLCRSASTVSALPEASPSDDTAAPEP